MINRAHKYPSKQIAFAVALFVMALNVPASVVPQFAKSSSPSVEILNASNVAAFADMELPEALRDGEIPGAVLSVVKDGRVLFQKGYGLADVKNNTSVSAQKTLFRVASVSKILTAASVLQLAQAGNLDLHQDVNHYLSRFSIAPAFDEPITLYNLLTHSSGFDVCRFFYGAHSAARKLSLHDYLSRFQPARVRPPGLFSSYDNYGYALAGYLVQKASGLPYREYVEERILEPLGMNHSVFAPDAERRKNLAVGYRLVREKLQPYKPDFVNIIPAAGLCTTAADMSRLLIALSSAQNSNRPSVFSTQVLEGLMKPQFAFNPEVPGRCYGFNQVTLEGRQALRQTGQWPGFNCVLLVLPGQNVGLFLAYNLCDELEMGRRVARSFVERFIPEPKPRAMAKHKFANNNRPLDFLAGTYASTRSPRETVRLTDPREVIVQNLPDGKLEIAGQTYQQIAPWVFERTSANPARHSTPGRRVAFRVNGSGESQDLITQSGAFRRVPWFETRLASSRLNYAVLFTLLCPLIFWPIAGLIRRGRAQSPPIQTEQNDGQQCKLLPLIAKVVALLVCALTLWFQADLALTLAETDPFAYFYGLPASVASVLELVPVLIVPTLALPVFLVLAWRRRYWNFTDRMIFTAITVVSLVYCCNLYSRHFLAGRQISDETAGRAVVMAATGTQR